MKFPSLPIAVLAAWFGCVAPGAARADTGSPPPPALDEEAVFTPTKSQVRAFTRQILPAYSQWLRGGAACNCYPAFALFISTYPCAAGDRGAYLWLYLQQNQ
jgi:hypothetical protein